LRLDKKSINSNFVLIKHKRKISNSKYTPPSLISIEGPLKSLIVAEDIDNND